MYLKRGSLPLILILVLTLITSCIEEPLYGKALTDTPVCGDGKLDELNEVCDDGNTFDDDYCSSDCQSVIGRCGDSTRQNNERCDDGNRFTETFCQYGEETCTACNADCSVSLSLTGSYCGDGTLDELFETCDDGNTVSGDYCSSNCQSVTGRCGDGTTQSNEQCDDGINNGNLGYCNYDCNSQVNQICGDGIVSGNEECDEGDRASQLQLCTLQCTFECGNGIVNLNRGEVCDDGNRFTESFCSYGEQACTVCNADCSASLSLTGSYCGDGVMDDIAENCDDGNTVSGDYCSANCQSRTGRCGDGIRQNNEQCDDGNQVNTDSCSNSCTTQSVQSPRCGDGFTQSGEECDDGNTISNDGCSSLCRIDVVNCGTDLTCFEARFRTCTRARISISIEFGDITTGLGLVTYEYEILGSAGTECRVRSGFTENPSPEFNNKFMTCNYDNSLTFDDALTIVSDSFNTNNPLGSCTGELYDLLRGTCGDGIIDVPRETCDDGNTISETSCSYGMRTCNLCNSDCSASLSLTGAYCGDGTRQGSEQCDDGNQVNTDSCTNTCRNSRCGDGIIRSGVEQCDDGNQVNNDGCRNSCLNPRCGDGILDDLTETCDDGNSNNNDACTNLCSLSSCGDGIVQSGEACDDGNNQNTDNCLNTCVRSSCGDGFVQVTERCDDGNQVNTDGCLNTCVRSSCGDGFVHEGVEFCDGNNLAGKSCTSSTIGDFTGGNLACASNCLSFETNACLTQSDSDDGDDDDKETKKSTGRVVRCVRGYVLSGGKCVKEEQTVEPTTGDDSLPIVGEKKLLVTEKKPFLGDLSSRLLDFGTGFLIAVMLLLACIIAFFIVNVVKKRNKNK